MDSTTQAADTANSHRFTCAHCARQGDPYWIGAVYQSVKGAQPLCLPCAQTVAASRKGRRRVEKHLQRQLRTMPNPCDPRLVTIDAQRG